MFPIGFSTYWVVEQETPEMRVLRKILYADYPKGFNSRLSNRLIQCSIHPENVAPLSGALIPDENPS